MAVLAVANSKGGQGKTPLAYNLAVMRAIQGFPVVLIDADVQDSSTDLVKGRGLSGLQPAITLVRPDPDPDAVTAAIVEAIERGLDVVVDVGGNLDGALLAAITEADTVLVPIKPADRTALDALTKLDDKLASIMESGRADLQVLPLLTDLPSLPTQRAKAAATGRAALDACAALRYVEGLEAVERPQWGAALDLDQALVEYERDRWQQAKPAARRRLSLAAAYELAAIYAAAWGDLFDVDEFVKGEPQA